MSFIFKVFSLWLELLFLIERPSLELQIKNQTFFQIVYCFLQFIKPLDC